MTPEFRLQETQEQALMAAVWESLSPPPWGSAHSARRTFYLKALRALHGFTTSTPICENGLPWDCDQE